MSLACPVPVSGAPTAQATSASPETADVADSLVSSGCHADPSQSCSPEYPPTKTTLDGLMANTSSNQPKSLVGWSMSVHFVPFQCTDRVRKFSSSSSV